ncbi:MAG: hypothetical protein EA401_08070 [Planctomycetota bacterium]|nr:MAG: hypothetical protein EA401_08070 [Planctomycetota bacterium]
MTNSKKPRRRKQSVEAKEDPPYRSERHIVLDTNVIRDLAHGTPDWLENLATLAEAGLEISIHDLATLELTTGLLDHVATGKFGAKVDYVGMWTKIEPVLSKRIPVWPGKNDWLNFYPNSPDSGHPTVRSRLVDLRHQFEALKSSLRAGRFLHTRYIKNKQVFTAGTEATFRSAVDLAKIEKEKWISLMDRAKDSAVQARADGAEPLSLEVLTEISLRQLEKEFPHIPDVRARLDLAMRHFAWYQYMVAKDPKAGPVNHRATSRENDGLDAYLPFALFWPCHILTSDKGALSRMQAVDSPQAMYFLHPSDALRLLPS